MNWTPVLSDVISELDMIGLRLMNPGGLTPADQAELSGLAHAQARQLRELGLELIEAFAGRPPGTMGSAGTTPPFEGNTISDEIPVASAPAAIVDELHEHRDRSVVDALERN